MQKKMTDLSSNYIFFTFYYIVCLLRMRFKSLNLNHSDFQGLFKDFSEKSLKERKSMCACCNGSYLKSERYVSSSWGCFCSVFKQIFRDFRINLILDCIASLAWEWKEGVRCLFFFPEINRALQYQKNNETVMYTTNPE